jgi:FlaA1/EpsC-like NDP-sugar epimerase
MSILSRRYTPRWIVFLIDVFICTASIAIAYLLRFNFKIPITNVASLYFIIPYVVGIRIVSFILARTYAGIVRYTGLKDAQRIVITVFSGSLFIVITNYISLKFITKAHIVPLSIVIIDFMTTVFFMTSLRWLVKAVFFQYRTTAIKMKKVVIYGTGYPALRAKSALEEDFENRYKWKHLSMIWLKRPIKNSMAFQFSRYRTSKN